MTKTARALLDRMAELAQTPGSGWELIPGTAGTMVRLTLVHQTPDLMRRTWDQDEYRSHTFVTLVAGKVILGTSAGPWMGRNDREIPFWLAREILNDEEDLAQDLTRMFDLRAARRTGKR